MTERTYNAATAYGLLAHNGEVQLAFAQAFYATINFGDLKMMDRLGLLIDKPQLELELETTREKQLTTSHGHELMDRFLETMTAYPELLENPHVTAFLSLISNPKSTT